MEPIYLILIAVAAFGAVILLFRLRSLSQTPRVEPMSPEQKAEWQLERFERRLRGRIPPLRGRHVYQYYKGLRVVLSVYAEERYGIMIRDGITPQTVHEIENRTPAEAGRIEELERLFEELEKFRDGAAGYEELAELFSRARQLIGGTRPA